MKNISMHYVFALLGFLLCKNICAQHFSLPGGHWIDSSAESRMHLSRTVYAARPSGFMRITTMTSDRDTLIFQDKRGVLSGRNLLTFDEIDTVEGTVRLGRTVIIADSFSIANVDFSPGNEYFIVTTRRHSQNSLRDTVRLEIFHFDTLLYVVRAETDLNLDGGGGFQAWIDSFGNAFILIKNRDNAIFRPPLGPNVSLDNETKFMLLDRKGKVTSSVSLPIKPELGIQDVWAYDNGDIQVLLKQADRKNGNTADIFEANKMIDEYVLARYSSKGNELWTTPIRCDNGGVFFKGIPCANGSFILYSGIMTTMASEVSLVIEQTKVFAKLFTVSEDYWGFNAAGKMVWHTKLLTGKSSTQQNFMLESLDNKIVISCNSVDTGAKVLEFNDVEGRKKYLYGSSFGVIYMDVATGRQTWFEVKDSCIVESIRCFQLISKDRFLICADFRNYRSSIIREQAFDRKRHRAKFLFGTFTTK